jgi:general stress protein 26
MKNETNIIDKAAELLAGQTEITLASVNENGYPRICVLSKTGSNGLNKVYCATDSISTKVRHFKENPKASVCAWHGNNSITLLGNVTVRTDREIKADMWLDWFPAHFPAGIDDPNYCVLEFSTEEAALWIDGEFVTIGGDELH